MIPRVIAVLEPPPEGCEGPTFRAVETERGLIFEAREGVDAMGADRWSEVECGSSYWSRIAYRLAKLVAGQP